MSTSASRGPSEEKKARKKKRIGRKKSGGKDGMGSIDRTTLPAESNRLKAKRSSKT